MAFALSTASRAPPLDLAAVEAAIATAEKRAASLTKRLASLRARRADLVELQRAVGIPAWIDTALGRLFVGEARGEEAAALGSRLRGGLLTLPACAVVEHQEGCDLRVTYQFNGNPVCLERAIQEADGCVESDTVAISVGARDCDTVGRWELVGENAWGIDTTGGAWYTRPSKEVEDACIALLGAAGDDGVGGKERLGITRALPAEIQPLALALLTDEKCRAAWKEMNGYR